VNGGTEYDVHVTERNSSAGLVEGSPTFCALSLDEHDVGDISDGRGKYRGEKEGSDGRGKLHDNDKEKRVEIHDGDGNTK
jgi:hypothetical protein